VTKIDITLRLATVSRNMSEERNNALEIVRRLQSARTRIIGVRDDVRKIRFLFGRDYHDAVLSKFIDPLDEILSAMRAHDDLVRRCFLDSNATPDDWPYGEAGQRKEEEEAVPAEETEKTEEWLFIEYVLGAVSLTDVEDRFERYGRIARITIKSIRKDDENGSMCFLLFSDRRDVRAALAENGTEWRGRRISVRIVRKNRREEDEEAEDEEAEDEEIEEEWKVVDDGKRPVFIPMFSSANDEEIPEDEDDEAGEAWLFIEGVPGTVSRDEVLDRFGRYGRINRITIKTLLWKKSSRNLLLRFVDQRDAQNALAENGTEWRGERITVEDYPWRRCVVRQEGGRYYRWSRRRVANE